MNKEEKEFFYSIGRGSLNLNGKFYYGLDYSITDFMNSSEQENKKYKEVINKLKEWINIVQQNKDNKHLEPFISTDELDELLDILVDKE